MTSYFFSRHLEETWLTRLLSSLLLISLQDHSAQLSEFDSLGPYLRSALGGPVICPSSLASRQYAWFAPLQFFLVLSWLLSHFRTHVVQVQCQCIVLYPTELKYCRKEVSVSAYKLLTITIVYSMSVDRSAQYWLSIVLVVYLQTLLHSTCKQPFTQYADILVYALERSKNVTILSSAIFCTLHSKSSVSFIFVFLYVYFQLSAGLEFQCTITYSSVFRYCN